MPASINQQTISCILYLGVVVLAAGVLSTMAFPGLHLWANLTCLLVLSATARAAYRPVQVRRADRRAREPNSYAITHSTPATMPPALLEGESPP